MTKKCFTFHFEEMFEGMTFIKGDMLEVFSGGF